MTTFNEKILNIVSDLGNNPFKGKWVSILGDSISTYPGYIPSNMIARDHEGFDTVNKTWWHQVLTKLDAKLCVNCSCSGMLASGEDTLLSAAFNEYATKLSREVGQSYINLDGSSTMTTEKIDPDIILVYLGTNDYIKNAEKGEFNLLSEVDITKHSTFIEGYETILHDMLSTYPYATVYCISPHSSRINNGTPLPFANTASTPWNCSAMSEDIRLMALKFNYKYISLNEMCVHGSNAFVRDIQFLLPDRIHPSIYGHELIAKKVIHDMINNPVSWTFKDIV